jgi:hypothetical protein
MAIPGILLTGIGHDTKFENGQKTSSIPFYQKYLWKFFQSPILWKRFELFCSPLNELLLKLQTSLRTFTSLSTSQISHYLRSLITKSWLVYQGLSDNRNIDKDLIGPRCIKILLQLICSNLKQLISDKILT